MSIQELGQNKALRAIKNKNGSKVPDRGRKSIESDVRGQREVIPSSSTLSVLAFLPLLGVFELMKVHFVRSIGSGFKSEYFIVLLFVWLCCSVVKRGKRVRGVSVSSLCVLVYSDYSALNSRSMNYKLSLLVKSGLLVRERSVSSSGYYLYSVSSVAEKLLLSKVDVKTVRELNALVKSVL